MITTSIVDECKTTIMLIQRFPTVLAGTSASLTSLIPSESSNAETTDRPRQRRLHNQSRNSQQGPRTEVGQNIRFIHAFLTLLARIITNAVVRSKGDKMSYFGHEIARCKDYSSLHYRLPFEKVQPDQLRYTIYSKVPFVGLSRWLGRAKGCLGRYLFRWSPWGKKFMSSLLFIVYLVSSCGTTGWHYSVLSADYRAILQSAQYTGHIRPADIRRVRIQLLSSMHPWVHFIRCQSLFKLLISSIQFSCIPYSTWATLFSTWPSACGMHDRGWLWI